jgi:thiamine biosynthesis protein ThiI
VIDFNFLDLYRVKPQTSLQLNSQIDLRMIDRPKKFIALLSSGLDSPIATYLMIKRGHDATILSYNISEPNDMKFVNKITQVAQLLRNLTKSPLTVYIVDHKNTLQQFIEHGKRKLTCVLCKTYMLFGAYALAEMIHADFIVNGDILGEQASQTMQNIAAIQHNKPDIPIIRPLVGYDKHDILKLSHQLGFYDLSQLPDTQCTFNPLYPETHATAYEIQENLNRVDLESIARSNLKNARVLVVD